MSEVNNQNEGLNEAGADAGPTGIPLAASARRFLIRTGIMTVVTMLLVAMFAAVYVNKAWAGRYLFAAGWSLVFFTLTPLTFKAFLFDRNVFAGIAWMGAKFGAIAFMIYAVSHWFGGQPGLMLGSALLAGLSTP